MRHAESRFGDSTHGVGKGRARAKGLFTRRAAAAGADGTGAPASGLGLTLALLCLLALVLAPPVPAALRHSVFTNEFGPDGTSGTSFSNVPGGIAYQQANKRIYVLSNGTNQIFGLGIPSPGTYTPLGGNFPFAVVPQTGDDGIAVDNTSGPTKNNIYFSPDYGAIKIFNASGSEVGEFSPGAEPCGVAVDNGGNIWVGNWGRNQVEQYGPGGGQIQSFSTSGGPGNSCKVGVDTGNNDVYAISYGGGGIWKYTAASGYTDKTKIAPSNGGARVTINATKHVLYVTHQGTLIEAIDTNTGQMLEEIQAGGSYHGIAVDETNDTLYAFSPTTNRVREIPLALVPKAVTGEPVGNRKVSATVAPDGAGNITECKFEWGTNTQYTKEAVPCEQATPITTETLVTAELPESETTLEQEYHYRIRAGTETLGGVNFGLDEKLKPHHVPALKTEAATAVARGSAQLHGSFDGNGEATEYQFEWGEGKIGQGPLTSNSGFQSAGEPVVHTALNVSATGLNAGTTYHFRVVAKNAGGESIAYEKEFTTLPAVSNLSTEDATEVTLTAAILHGSFDIDAEGGDTHYFFEYGPTETYGAVVPLGAPPGEDQGSTVGHPSVQKSIEVQAGKTVHFRLVASNTFGATVGSDKSFEAPDVPKIASTTSANVTATTAELLAQINPGGFASTYKFEYGTTPAYGQSTPIGPEGIGSGKTAVPVNQQVTGLTVGATYHFRVVAENEWGSAASEDQTFEFFTPDCPNAHLRQQTGAAYLPDCRAYELVSPRSTPGVQIFPGFGLGTLEGEVLFAPSPNTGLATGPSRVSFWAGIGQLPGTNPPNILQDAYVSTRTAAGWETHFPGIPGSESVWSGAMRCDSGLARCISYAPGGILEEEPYREGSNAPTVFNSDEDSVPTGRFPTMVESIPNGEEFEGDRGLPSADFSHFAFSSNNVPFTPGGLEAAPGSAYDNDTIADSVDLISMAEGGGNLTQDSAGCTVEPNKERQCQFEFIRIPAISSDGSHILMSNWAEPPKGQFESESFQGPDTYPLRNIHLTMRVDDETSYDVTKGHRSNFAGMTRDGSKVYFTSDEQVTADDHDTSIDLFMWSEATNQVTRLSAGTGGTGDTDSCSASWTSSCSIQVAGDTLEKSEVFNGESKLYNADNWIADNGDVYFYSPEQFEGPAKGGANLRNLYVYREGHAQLVAALSPTLPAVRMQVAPDDSRVALLTRSKLKESYENSGHTEMFTIDPPTGKVTCVSCVPTGETPTSDVAASENGLFMTDDGRTFFSTRDALVPFDTDGVRDVYEYVSGRPQLITSGTAQQDTWGGGLLVYPAMTTGLEGVSADGTDAYFSTFDTLTRIDENGEFIKIYDARTGGGFPGEEPPPPCKAADECHGAGSTAPPPQQLGTGAALGSTGSSREDCGAPGRKAKKSSREAKRLRRKAAQTSGRKAEKRLLRRARKEAQAANRASKEAKRCRKRAKARRAG